MNSGPPDAFNFVFVAMVVFIIAGIVISAITGILGGGGRRRDSSQRFDPLRDDVLFPQDPLLHTQNPELTQQQQDHQQHHHDHHASHPTTMPDTSSHHHDHSPPTTMPDSGGHHHGG